MKYLWLSTSLLNTPLIDEVLNLPVTDAYALLAEFYLFEVIQVSLEKEADPSLSIDKIPSQ